MSPQEIINNIEKSEQYSKYIMLRKEIGESNNKIIDTSTIIRKLREIIGSIRRNEKKVRYIGHGDYRIVYKYDKYIIKFPIGSTVETDMELELIRYLESIKADTLLEHIVDIYHISKDKIMVQEFASPRNIDDNKLNITKELFLKNNILLPDIYFNQLGEVNGVVKVFDFGIWRNI